MFTGEYRHSVDDKGRIAVPSRFRAQLDGGAVVSRWLDACLAIHTKTGWDALAADLIGITGAGTKAVRAKGVEAGLTGKALDAATIQAAAEKAPDGVDVQADLQGSEEYKRHLLKVFARRAIEAASAAVK